MAGLIPAIPMVNALRFASGSPIMPAMTSSGGSMPSRRQRLRTDRAASNTIFLRFINVFF